MIALSLPSPRPAIVEPAFSFPVAPSFWLYPPVASSPESPVAIAFVAQLSSPELTAPRGSVIRILRDRLDRLVERFFCLDKPFIVRAAQLESFQDQFLALVRSRDTLWSDREAVRCKLVFWDEKSSLFVILFKLLKLLLSNWRLLVTLSVPGLLLAL